jgi:hypothetical protein
MADHTPGPWKAVYLAETQYIADRWEVQYGNDGECIAEFVHEPADARLIAAAPEMLAMLEDILSMVHEDGCRPWISASFDPDEVVGLIAKATGREVTP